MYVLSFKPKPLSLASGKGGYVLFDTKRDFRIDTCCFKSPSKIWELKHITCWKGGLKHVWWRNHLQANI